MKSFDGGKACGFCGFMKRVEVLALQTCTKAFIYFIFSLCKCKTFIPYKFFMLL